MRRGRLFEPVVLEILREDHPNWSIQPSRAYHWDDQTRIGCTPDAIATREDDVYGFGTIQIKTVGQFAFKRRWHDETGAVAVPTWVAVQASIEAYLMGASWAGVAALKLGDGGIEIAYIEIPLKPHLIQKIEDLTADFWGRVLANEPYDPDFGRDRKVVFDLYAEGKGPIIDLTDDAEFREIIATREQLKQVEKAGENAATQRKVLDARIIHKLGNASAARSAGTLVTVTVVRKKPYTVKSQQYPLVTVKKGVEDGE